MRTQRKLAAGIAGPRAGYTDAKQALEALAREFGLNLRFEAAERAPFIPGRSGRVFGQGPGELEWGIVGEVHPEVLSRFGITQPVSLFEVDLSALL